jgi:hypothetical protein
MAHTVIRLRLTAKAIVRASVSLRGIHGGQSGTGTGFHSSSTAFTWQYYTTMALHSYITWGINSRPASDRSSET